MAQALPLPPLRPAPFLPRDPRGLDLLDVRGQPGAKSLRQPLEEHEVNIVRSRFKASFPSRPLLVAAMNPCPCGFESG